MQISNQKVEDFMTNPIKKISTYKTAKTKAEMLEKINGLEPNDCFAVTYDSFDDEYKIWCGNRPYGFFENEILKRNDEIIKLIKQVNRQNEIIDCLLKSGEVKEPKIERVSLLDEGRVGYFLTEEEYTKLSSYLGEINQASNRHKK
ncbi:hypothetical protein [Bacillus sp. TH13]|uniref:hypothetical protein n=1 Tax=Bacillus sp. TH13 TaxID=2796379 RepID=UPI001F5BA26C|nr:hypothetical protein [Bacillus sp. TH13]